jgi:hypothetical protein
MPKAETRDYFRTTIDQVEQEQLGALSVLLAKAGFTQVRHELVTDVLRYKQKASHDVKAEDFLIDWMAEHPTFKAVEAVKHFREAGRTDSSCYTALRVLVERKLLRKLGEGQYSRLDVKHQPKQAKQVQVRREVDNHTFILRAASKNHGRFNTAWMKKQFEADGRGPGSVSPTIAALMTKKLIKRVAESEYVLLQTKEVKKKPAKKKPVTKANGGAPAQELLHG